MQAATLLPLQTPVGHDAAPVTAEQPNHLEFTQNS